MVYGAWFHTEDFDRERTSCPVARGSSTPGGRPTTSYGLWFMVYGLWFMVFGSFHTADVEGSAPFARILPRWFIVHGLWLMVDSLWLVVR